MTETQTIYEEASNWAEARKAYYEHDDFKVNYSYYLLEDTTEADRHIKRILEELYESFKAVPEANHQSLFEAIREHINDNFDDYSSDFKGYYVGYHCIDSITFGEQEEEIPEEYQTSPEALEAIGTQGFYVDHTNAYAYYNLSDEGIKITIDEKDKQIDDLIAKFK